jgi:hypothetical protein
MTQREHNYQRFEEGESLEFIKVEFDRLLDIVLLGQDPTMTEKFLQLTATELEEELLFDYTREFNQKLSHLVVVVDPRGLAFD